MKLRKRKGEHQFTDPVGVDILVLDEALCLLLTDIRKKLLDSAEDPTVHAHYEEKQMTTWRLLGQVVHIRRGDCDGPKCYHSVD